MQRAVVRVTVATVLLLRILVHLSLMPVAAVAVETRQPRLLVDLVAVATAEWVMQEAAQQAQQILAVAAAVLVCNFLPGRFFHQQEMVVPVS